MPARMALAGQKAARNPVGRDRLPVRQKPRFGAKRIKPALIGRRFELVERIQYITTKTVWIIATERDLNLA